MKKKNKRKSHVSFRMNILFLGIFALFSVLILRLGLVQIVHGESYQREVERTEDVTVNTPVPRGRMYDRYNRVIVDNTPLNAITYTRFQGNTAEERLKIARQLAKLIDVPYSTDAIDVPEKTVDENAEDIVKITERDLKDYWIMLNPKEAEKKISDSDRSKVEAGEMTDEELYNRQLSRITKRDLQTLADDLEVLAIKRQMEAGYAQTPQIIKKNVTPAEFAIVSENLSQLPGVDTTTYWERYYPQGGTLRTLLGNVSSANEGLPRDKVDYYLSRGYSRNDQVGTSYLEKEYESQLKGQKEQVQYITDRSGNLIDTLQLTEGQRGSDLVLTIDIELQQAVEEAITKQLIEKKQMSGTRFLDRAFVVMMDPNTGEILTMAGKRYTTDSKTGAAKIEDFALGNLSTSYTMGSVVKGATVLAGLDSGAITTNTIFVDEPIKFAGTKEKKSFKNMGPINYSTALKQSSNVFMFKTVMAMADVQYRYNGSLPIKANTFAQLRSYYSQFGLGVSTGIELDNEATGFQGGSSIPGTALDLAIGQYDTYTPLQVVQYASTIANGGYRIKPQIVKEIRKPTIKEEEIGGVEYSFETQVLNRITMKQEYIKAVQSGLKRVTQEQGGSGYAAFASAPYNPAGKSGTAQAYEKNPNGGDQLQLIILHLSLMLRQITQK